MRSKNIGAKTLASYKIYSEKWDGR